MKTINNSDLSPGSSGTFGNIATAIHATPLIIMPPITVVFRPRLSDKIQSLRTYSYKLSPKFWSLLVITIHTSYNLSKFNIIKVKKSLYNGCFTKNRPLTLGACISTTLSLRRKIFYFLFVGFLHVYLPLFYGKYNFNND